MLIAETKNGERILAQDCHKEQSDLRCPQCQKAVILKKGALKIPHFAHRHLADCQSFSEGETAEHLQNKLFLQNWTKTGILEAYLPELKQRPDILWQNIAIEVQCSSMKMARFLERTENYQAHGYHPWWLLGKNLGPKRSGHAFTSLQKGATYFSPDQGAWLWLIRADTKAVWLLYDIHWSYQGINQFRVKKWFYKTDALSQLFVYRPHLTQATWAENDYRLYLQKKLMMQQRGVRRLQDKLYLLGGNLIDLPTWCYTASCYHFFFEDQLLFLRYCFLISTDFKEWLTYLKKLDFVWLFPLVSQKAILTGVYQECILLSQKQTFSAEKDKNMIHLF